MWTARIRHIGDGELRVRFYFANRPEPAADYFTNDMADAVGTMILQLRELNFIVSLRQ